MDNLSTSDMVKRFMDKFDKLYLNIPSDVRERVVKCVEAIVEVGKEHSQKPVTVENLEIFMTAGMMTQYGQNYSKKMVQDWSRDAYHPQADAARGIAIFMYQACLAIQGQEAANHILNIPPEVWVEQPSVWDALCVVPFFFILKDKS